MRLSPRPGVNPSEKGRRGLAGRESPTSVQIRGKTSPMRKIVWSGILLILFTAVFAEAPGYQPMVVGIDSNLAVVEGRVVFVQGDEGLTALDVDTGDVVQRKTDQDYAGVFEVANGRLFLYWGPYDAKVCSRLDPDTLDIVWTAEMYDFPWVYQDYYIAKTTKEEIVCRSIDSGRTLWETRVEPGGIVDACPSYVVLKWKGKGDRSPEGSTFHVYDMDTGAFLFLGHVAGPSSALCFYSSKEKIFVLTGPPLSDDWTSASLERLLVFDRTGKQLEALEIPRETFQETDYRIPAFTLQGQTFYPWGSVLPSGEEPRESDSVRVLWFIHGLSFDSAMIASGVFEEDDIDIAYDADSVPLGHRRYESLAIGRFTPRSGTGWTGYFPYLSPYGGIRTVAEYQGKLLIGSNRGHVECVDLAEGRSLWLYSFPFVVRTMSYTFPGGMPPTRLEQARSFEEDYKAKRPESGVVRLPDNLEAIPENAEAIRALATTATTRVVVDPDPINPFRESLTEDLVLIWGLAVIPFPLLALTLVVRRKRKWLKENSVWVALVAFLGAWVAFLSDSWLSAATLVAEKIAIAVTALAVVAFAVEAIRRRRRIRAIVALAILFLALYRIHYAFLYLWPD